MPSHVVTHTIVVGHTAFVVNQATSPYREPPAPAALMPMCWSVRRAVFWRTFINVVYGMLFTNFTLAVASVTPGFVVLVSAVLGYVVMTMMYMALFRFVTRRDPRTYYAAFLRMQLDTVTRGETPDPEMLRMEIARVDGHEYVARHNSVCAACLEVPPGERVCR